MDCGASQGPPTASIPPDFRKVRISNLAQPRNSEHFSGCESASATIPPSCSHWTDVDPLAISTFGIVEDVRIDRAVSVVLFVPAQDQKASIGQEGMPAAKKICVGVWNVDKASAGHIPQLGNGFIWPSPAVHVIVRIIIILPRQNLPVGQHMHMNTDFSVPGKHR